MNPTPTELKIVDYHLSGFEKEIESAAGRPLTHSRYKNPAEAKIEAIAQKYPGSKKVQELKDRFTKAVAQGEGDSITLSDDALNYRTQESEIHSFLVEDIEGQWLNLIDELKASHSFLKNSFPVPSFTEVDFDEIEGSLVVLESFDYPKKQFNSGGKSYLQMGSRSDGHYFLNLSNPSFFKVYGALKRYGRTVSTHFPTPWKVIGQIIDITMMSPTIYDSVSKPVKGWMLDVLFIYVPQTTFCYTKLTGDFNAFFFKEEELEAIKSGYYSIKEIPKNVDPEELIVVFNTAIKEKNLALYWECLDDAWSATEMSKSRALFMWENSQRKYREAYAFVEPEIGKTEITKIEQKVNPSDQQGDIRHVIEKATVPVKIYSDEGKLITKSVAKLQKNKNQEWRVVHGWH